jgi:hypothetical protein
VAGLPVNSVSSQAGQFGAIRRNKKVGRRYIVVGCGVVMVSSHSKGMRLTDIGLLAFALSAIALAAILSLR